MNKHSTNTGNIQSQTVIITPDGLNLAHLERLGKTLEIIAEELRDAYITGDFGAVIAFEDEADRLMGILGLPSLSIDYDFIIGARFDKGLSDRL
jgi:hypothetical protein